MKLVPVTEPELAVWDTRTTRDVFEFPPAYHYRVGSLGFGARRELEVCRATSEWVAQGECEAFPLLYGRRLVPLVPGPAGRMHDRGTFGDHPAVLRRHAESDAATMSVALVSEAFETSLGDWLRSTSDSPETRAAAAIAAERCLLDVVDFLASKGVAHMDPHFENVVTNDGAPHLTDFGLSLSQSFELSPDEREFAARHTTFDRATVVTCAVHAVVTAFDSPCTNDESSARPTDWRASLRYLLDAGNAQRRGLPTAVREYLDRRSPVALAMGTFLRRVAADPAAHYPDDEFSALLGE